MPGWIAHLCASFAVCNGFRMTPADLLVSSMAVEPFDPHMCTGIGGVEPGIACAARFIIII